MKYEINNATIVQKELVQYLKLNLDEVLDNLAEIKAREKKLVQAVILGNINKHKIKIYFKDESKLNFVETTVWGLTDKRVILKSGIVIPINRIIYVKLL
jgi:hypothetical protein